MSGLIAIRPDMSVQLAALAHLLTHPIEWRWTTLYCSGNHATASLTIPPPLRAPCAADGLRAHPACRTLRQSRSACAARPVLGAPQRPIRRARAGQVRSCGHDARPRSVSRLSPGHDARHGPGPRRARRTSPAMTTLPLASPVCLAPRPPSLAYVGPCPRPTSWPGRGRVSILPAPVAEHRRLTTSAPHARVVRCPDQEPCTT